MEANLRVKKVKDAIEQQQKLHEIQMEIEKQQLKLVEAYRKKAEVKRELKELKLLRKKNE